MRRLCSLAGKRLPTEAEWERAAKGPNSYRYAYGNAFEPQKANSGTQKTAPLAPIRRTSSVVRYDRKCQRVDQFAVFALPVFRLRRS